MNETELRHIILLVCWTEESATSSWRWSVPAWTFTLASLGAQCEYRQKQAHAIQHISTIWGENNGISVCLLNKQITILCAARPHRVSKHMHTHTHTHTHAHTSPHTVTQQALVEHYAQRDVNLDKATQNQ